MNEDTTLTDIVFSKLPYLIVLCICMLLFAYSRTRISSTIAQIPHDNMVDFVMKYIQSESNAVGLSMLSLLLAVALLIYSCISLAKKFFKEEKRSNILNGVIFAANISLTIYGIVISKTLFVIVGTIIIVLFIFLAMFGSLASREN
jgi:hypothetical protein